MLRTLLGLGLPLVLGLPFTLALTSWPARLGMAFLSGVVIIAVGLTLVGVAGLRFSPLTVAPLGVAWLVLAFLAARAHRAEWWTPSWRPSGLAPVTLVLLLLTAINVTTAAAYASKTPAFNTDVLVIWLPKARLIASSGFDALARSVYPDYPPLWPLHLYAASGGAPWLKLLPTAYLVATLVVVFHYVGKRLGLPVAAVCVFAISGVPYIWFPYGVDDLMADVPMMAFMTASTLMVADFVESRSFDSLALGVIAAMGVVLVRPEGFIYGLILCVVLAAVQLARRRVESAVIPAAAVVLTYIGWQGVVRFRFDNHGTFRFGASLFNAGTDLRAVADTLIYAAVNVGNPYLFGPAVIAGATLLLGYRHWRIYGLIVTVLALYLLATVAIYSALPATDVGEPSIWWLTTGFKRAVMHVIPLLYVAAALATGALWRERRFLKSQIDLASISRPTRAAASLALALVILAAGYAASTGGGPKVYGLSALYPSHVYGPAVDYTVPGIMTVATGGQPDPQVVYYLQNLGRRIPPLDNATGTFTRFSARVEAKGPPSVTEEFVASADGREFARAVVVPGYGPATVEGNIPLGARLLELTVVQMGSGSATVSWLQPTVYRVSAWWAVDAFLVLALITVLISAAAALGVLKLQSQPGLGSFNPTVISVMLLAAAAVQQFEATFALAVPSWSFAARLIGID